MASPGSGEAAAAAASALLSTIPCHKAPEALAHPEVAEAVRHVAALERMLGGWGAQVSGAGRGVSAPRLQHGGQEASERRAAQSLAGRCGTRVPRGGAGGAELCRCRGPPLQSLPSADMLVSYFHMKVGVGLLLLAPLQGEAAPGSDTRCTEGRRLIWSARLAAGVPVPHVSPRSTSNAVLPPLPSAG